MVSGGDETGPVVSSRYEYGIDQFDVDYFGIDHFKFLTHFMCVIGNFNANLL